MKKLTPLLIMLSLFPLFTSAQAAPTINTFISNSGSIQSGQSIGLSWNITNSAGSVLTISCADGVVFENTNGSGLTCNSALSFPNDESSAVDIIAYNFSGGARSVSASVTPKDISGSLVPANTTNLSFTVQNTNFPIASFTVNKSIADSYEPLTLSWQGVRGLTGVNLSLRCGPNLEATSTSYNSGKSLLPCGGDLFSSTALPATGSYTFSVLNKTTSDISPTFVILPASSASNFDALRSKTLDVTILPPKKNTPSLTSFTSSALSVISQNMLTFSWVGSNTVGLNFSISCSEALTPSLITATATTAPPCTNSALTSSLPSSGTATLMFENRGTAPLSVTLVAIPEVTTGLFNATLGKTLLITVYPKNSTLPTTTSAPLETRATSTTTISSTKATVKITLPFLTKGLLRGMTHKEVITLQIFLARDKKIYPEASVSGFFGSATEKAVMRFQEKYSITRKGVVGYGQVGPKTRTKVNELLNL